MDRRQDSSCKPCPFSAAGQGDISNPVYQSPPSNDDPSCFAKCKDAFLLSLDEGSLDANGSITADGCQYLADNGEGGDLFHALYYLDVTYCGLGRVGSSGQDPNVNAIKNSCNAYGFTTLSDPGWPSSTYSCGLCTATTKAGQSGTMSIDGVATSSASLSATSVSSRLSTTATPTSASSGQVTTGSASATNPDAADSTSASHDAVSADATPQLSTQGLVAIVICTTLALASAVLLLLCVLRRRRKQQETYSHGSGSRTSRMMSDFNLPPTASYQPLMSSSHSMADGQPPMTPPLRLGERRLLPSLLRPISRTESLVFGPPFETRHLSGGSFYSIGQSGQSTKHDAASTKTAVSAARSSFLSSPVCTPMARKLEPRQEKMQGHHHYSNTSSPKTTAAASDAAAQASSSPYTRLKSPPPVSFGFFPRPASLERDDGGSGSNSNSNNNNNNNSYNNTRGSGSKKPGGDAGFGLTTYSSARTSASSDYSSGLAPPLLRHHQQYPQPYGTPPGSPVRPRRPHEEMLEIPDLVKPAPSPRQQQQQHFSSSSSLLSLPPLPTVGGFGSGLGAGLGQGQGQVQGGIGVARTTPGAGTVSLSSLAEQHRDSWGSWGEDAAAPGRLFGVAFPPGSSRGRGMS